MTTAMNETDKPVGPAEHPGDAQVDRGRPNHGASRRPRAVSLVAGSIACVLALVFLSGGGWALWKDRVDRDADGFVSFGTEQLRTETYAIVGDLRGDGPSWLWGSTVLGDARVRASSESEGALFIGIAPRDAVLGYLRDAGYATVDSFEVRADTTRDGGPPSGPPSGESIWAASTQGTGEQTLLWKPRSGDWSIVFMNSDAAAGVAIDGDASAELPILPWLAAGLLVAGTASAVLGGWLLVRGSRGATQPNALVL